MGISLVLHNKPRLKPRIRGPQTGENTGDQIRRKASANQSVPMRFMPNYTPFSRNFHIPLFRPYPEKEAASGATCPVKPRSATRERRARFPLRADGKECINGVDSNRVLPKGQCPVGPGRARSDFSARPKQMVGCNLFKQKRLYHF